MAFPGPVELRRVAILFLTHVFDPVALAHLAKLKDESAGHGTFFVHADGRSSPPPGLDAPVVTFDVEAIRRTHPALQNQPLVPGNRHLPLLDFAKRYPAFDDYWVIEFDVAFSGHWGTFFSALAERREDLLAAHLRSRAEEPEWDWWAIEPPAGRPQPSALIRAFCPISRVSRRGIDLLERRALEGWHGHFECLMPTLLNDEGYPLADVGGDGRWVPQALRNRFYTSISWPDGRLKLGSMRYRPRIAGALSRRDTLYHPVKARGSIVQRLFQVLYVTRNLLRHPIRFTRALARLRRAR